LTFLLLPPTSLSLHSSFSPPSPLPTATLQHRNTVYFSLRVPLFSFSATAISPSPVPAIASPGPRRFWETPPQSS
jgi:hypothetical protein